MISILLGTFANWGKLFQLAKAFYMGNFLEGVVFNFYFRKVNLEKTTLFVKFMLGKLVLLNLDY